ncbi:MAG TPA: HD domain-containing protein [Desulfosalsimonadaceae bacterium]|nr:HD domain-containing protein [Desulfosalsimonadaceae bacterium]
MRIQPIDVISEFYPPGSKLRETLLIHSRAVADRALAIAGRLAHLRPDFAFIREAALLHDIGVYLTNAPSIGCAGKYPYICHGFLGREILEEKGLFRHALVCERHVGVGLTAAEIRSENLPLPEHDMRPVSLEEEIICYADNFFSKKPHLNGRPLAFDSVVENVATYGPGKVDRLLEWAARFEGIRQADVSSAGGGR